MEKLAEEKIFNALTRHGIIAFPTETVMGLGVLYDDEEAFYKLNTIKGRPNNKPYTLMLAKKENIEDFAYLNDLEERFIDLFMPGAVTILLKAKPSVPKWVDLGTGTIGVRVPDYDVSSDVLKAAIKPLLVPSANKSGEKPALDSNSVHDIFGEEIDYIVEGKAGNQEPSTIVQILNDEVEIIREGPIKLKDIKKKLEEHYENRNR